jgi:2-oxoglutarate ferredoxin oxidoreductase subunit beta
MVRRDVPVVYIIENNGVYGLTKGQFSATADVGSSQKSGRINELMPIDCCELAIQLGCGYVARSFSGDLKQLRALLKGAFAHRGTAVLDVVSPCVTFADHEGSTKSYAYVKEHDAPLHNIDFVPYYEDIHVDYAPGTTHDVTMPDGSHLVLQKLAEDYDPQNREQALVLLGRARRDEKLLTGLIYVDPAAKPLAQELNVVDEPLATLPAERVRPSREVLTSIMEGLRTGHGS